jgi:hypothetical protein
VLPMGVAAPTPVIQTDFLLLTGVSLQTQIRNPNLEIRNKYEFNFKTQFQTEKAAHN